MKKFYGVMFGNQWGITEIKPTSENFVLVTAPSRKEAEIKLAALVFQYQPEIYL